MICELVSDIMSVTREWDEMTGHLFRIIGSCKTEKQLEGCMNLCITVRDRMMLSIKAVVRDHRIVNFMSGGEIRRFLENEFSKRLLHILQVYFSTSEGIGCEGRSDD